MTWELAPSLARCREEANRLAPLRSKASDGTIGDQAHSTRTSDHNVGARNRVHALDLTHDPAGGWDAHTRVDLLRRAQDPRVKYIISNGRIASADKGWEWRPYSGSNPHDKHAHISILSTVAAETDTRPWWPPLAAPKPHSPSQTTSRTISVHLHPTENNVTHDRLEAVDQTGCAMWYTGFPWAKFQSVNACHPVHPAEHGYKPGVRADPVEVDGKICVVVTGGDPRFQTRIMLTVAT